MKIIHTDNFNRDYPDEKFVTELPPLSQIEAAVIATAINKTQPENSERFYVAVPDDYKLEPGFTP